MKDTIRVCFENVGMTIAALEVMTKKDLLSVVCAAIMLLCLHRAEAVDLLSTGGSGFGPIVPTVAEMDGDPTNGKEVAVVSSNGTVSVVRADGTSLWQATLPGAACSTGSASDRSYSSAAVGALFGDGVPYLVIGYGGFIGQACDGGIVAYRASDGQRKWAFSLRRWSHLKDFYSFRRAVYGTPVLADVNGDGRLEIGFGAFDRNIYLLNSNGTVRWYYHAADTVFGSPAFADVNRDGKPDMLIGTDISQNTAINPPTPNGGYLYALNASIQVPRGTSFRFRDPRLQIWRSQFDQVIQASPVVAELLPSAAGKELVIGAGCYFPEGSAAKRGRWYKVVSARSGKVLRTLKVSACTPSAAGVGDVDGDGSVDVVVAVSGDASIGGDGKSKLIAWNPRSNRILWKAVPVLGTRTDSYAGHHKRQPLVQDITGDGLPEVIITYSLGVVIFDGRTGEQLTCDTATCTDKPLLKVGSYTQGSAAVEDTDNDGIPEVLVPGKNRSFHGVARWEDPLGAWLP